MPSSGKLRRVALVKTDVSVECSASTIRVTRIGDLGTSAVTSNRRTLHGVTSQETAFFIVTAEETSNLTKIKLVGKTSSRPYIAMSRHQNATQICSMGRHVIRKVKLPCA
jgi:hypothetical protein